MSAAFRRREESLRLKGPRLFQSGHGNDFLDAVLHGRADGRGGPKHVQDDDKLKISFVQVVLSGGETNFDSIHGAIPVLWRDIDRLGCHAA